MSKIKIQREIFESYSDLIYNKLYFNPQSGGFVIAHKKHDVSKLKQNLNIAKYLTEYGEMIELVESVAHRKSNDAQRNDLLWKFKTVSQAQNLENAILMAVRKAKQFSENILIYINQPFSLSSIYKALETTIAKDRMDKIKRIDILMQRRLLRLTKDDILNGNHKTPKKPVLRKHKEPVSLEGHPKTTNILNGSTTKTTDIQTQTPSQ